MGRTEGDLGYSRPVPIVLPPVVWPPVGTGVTSLNTIKPKKRIAEEVDDASDSYVTYLEYNKILRTWFVAFGIGGPALLLVNKDAAQRLATLGELTWVAGLFLAGAALQIFGALVNKTANWYVYQSVHDEQNKSRIQYVVANFIIEQFWIDVFLDFLTAASFGWATWLLLTAFGVPV